jgi:hypothetical protein
VNQSEVFVLVPVLTSLVLYYSFLFLLLGALVF